MNFETSIDPELLKDLSHFFLKVNENACINQGWIPDNYLPLDRHGKEIPALNKNTEYFHPVITLDDRMRYICENIVSLDDADLSPGNKICNTIISHFYGARGIHQTLTNIKDPLKAHVDFERIAKGDKIYTDDMREIAHNAKANKVPIWGSTELHTSLQTAGRNFCRNKYDKPEQKIRTFDLAEWVASFITDGTVDDMLKSNSLEETYNILTKHRGIGDYYGYHCSTSNSVNPVLRFDNDDRFCKPGPGARATLDKLFPGISKKEYGNAIIWIRENQKKLFPELEFHENMQNIFANGTQIFNENQDELKVYGTEVGCCQFGVYMHLVANPHLAARRTVARAEDDSVCDGALLELVNF